MHPRGPYPAARFFLRLHLFEGDEAGLHPVLVAGWVGDQQGIGQILKGGVAPTGRDRTYRIQVRDFIAR